MTNNDLFDLCELMNTPNALVALTMGTDLSTEAWRYTDHLYWQKTWFNHFIHEHRRGCSLVAIV